MPQIVFLPHAELCPEGTAVEAKTGEPRISQGNVQIRRVMPSQGNIGSQFQMLGADSPANLPIVIHATMPGENMEWSSD